MNEITTVGLDLAKNVFQVHGVDAEGTTFLRKQLRRAQLLAFLMPSTFDEFLRNTLPIIMKCELTFRSERTRPAHAPSSGSETL